MTILNQYTPEELQPIYEGIRRFIRLLGLIHDENPLVWNKWFTDESDLKGALRSIADAMKATHTMVGKRKYQGVDFDAPNEVTKDLTTFLTLGADSGEIATLRKRNLPMLYLVIYPVIQLFYKFDHPTMIANADALIDQICTLVDNSTDYGSYHDALIAQQQVCQLIRDRDAARKAMQESKRKRKRRDPLLEMLAAFGNSREVEHNEESTEELYG